MSLIIGKVRTASVMPCESKTMSITVQLTDGFWKMNRRKRQAVIMFLKYNKDAEPSNWYGAKLMLYHLWYDEDYWVVMQPMRNTTDMFDL